MGPQHALKTVDSTRYLGDIFQCNGRLDMNIQDRVNRGYGSVKEIAAMLEEMCLGPWHFQSGKLQILRK